MMCTRRVRLSSVVMMGMAGVLVSVVVSGDDPALAGAEKPSADQLARGRALFARRWAPRDAQSPAGDGLGPVFNERSCLGCHNQGGPGGAGATASNVEVVTAVISVKGLQDKGAQLPHGDRENPKVEFWRDGITVNGKPISRVSTQEELEQLHPRFRESASIVLHRFGVNPRYAFWRNAISQILVEPEVEDPLAELRGTSRKPTSQRLLPGTLVLTRRNAPPLFGLGLIDEIPDEVIVAGADRRASREGGTRGRVSRLKDGRIGRFGWKAQAASLEDFVLAACANELGLEAPGHPQAVSPVDRHEESAGLDISQEDCSALVAYVRALPAPVAPGPKRTSFAIEAGRKLFEKVGCAACHTPDLGDVHGIYSDLLVHDLGSITPSGEYSGSSAAIVDSEWRTPPLWGFRDSAPYLHDGRAKTLEAAVAFHENQGQSARKQFFALPPEQRAFVNTFLRSLTAPAASQRHPRARSGVHNHLPGPPEPAERRAARLLMAGADS